MGRIDVILDDDFEQEFRMKVVERKGMKKGNLKTAITEAISKWMYEK